MECITGKDIGAVCGYGYGYGYGSGAGNWYRHGMGSLCMELERIRGMAMVWDGIDIIQGHWPDHGTYI